MSGYLEVQTGHEGAQRVPLAATPITIGRHPTNVVVIQDEMASRFHCVVEPAGEGWQVRDLQSRNGTWLNGQKVQASPLRPGDTLHVGSTLMRLTGAGVGAAAEPSPTRAGVDAPPREASMAAIALPPQAHEAQAIRRAPQLSQGQARNSLAGKQEHSAADTIRALRDLAATLPDRGADEASLALVSARGQTVHSSGQSLAEGDQSGSGDTIRVLRLLLTVALRIRGTDIHVEPKVDRTQVRMRVDGMMVDIVAMQPALSLRLMSAIKVLCDIDITQRSAIQEGHFNCLAGQRRIDFRISFTPAVQGQKLVIRVLDLSWAPQFMHNLGLPGWMFESLKQVVRADQGMVLACGPTGSGKTTTLYSMIRDIDVHQRNVVTIEDPVEYQIDGVTQIPINEHQGNTFSTILRSVLRQDPDVILVGEIRDAETARIAMQAAMTGHLVFSTVHAKDTIGTIFRILDLGVEPFLVASALNLVLAQRLVRLLCPHCKAEKRASSAEIMKLGKRVEGISKLYQPVGCPRCLQTGYSGRRAIFELLTTTDEARDVILKAPTLQDLRKAIRNTLFDSLVQGGYKLVLDGHTSMDEIERVIGSDA